MSKQMDDVFMFEDFDFVFLGAENLYSLFDPRSFGLFPTAPHTGCQKGFVLKFVTASRQLYLEGLKVYCSDGRYPAVYGVDPADNMDDMGMRLYQNIHAKLNYSGKILVGRRLKPEYHGRAFTGPHSYEITFLLTFSEGLLVKCEDTSGSDTYY